MFFAGLQNETVDLAAILNGFVSVLEPLGSSGSWSLDVIMIWLSNMDLKDGLAFHGEEFDPHVTTLPYV